MMKTKKTKNLYSPNPIIKLKILMKIGNYFMIKKKLVVKHQITFKDNLVLKLPINKFSKT